MGIPAGCGVKSSSIPGGESVSTGSAQEYQSVTDTISMNALNEPLVIPRVFAFVLVEPCETIGRFGGSDTRELTASARREE